MIVLLCCVLWILVPYAWRLKEVKELRSLCSQHRTIVLTFDDGPHSVLTRKILAIFQQNQIKASFFFLGQNVKDNTNTVTDVVAAGHDVGHHSFQHYNAWKTFPHSHLIDIKSGEQAIEIVGGDVTFFRAPYGKISLASWLYGLFRGYKFCWWTIDPKDSLENPRPHKDILDEITRNNGGVVLLHDNDTYPDPKHDEYVLSLVQKIIDLSKKNNLNIMSFSELIANKASLVN
jgi:peptidoglycan/xylan/chitin deacetylase (PgdA/CDA1 family)